MNQLFDEKNEEQEGEEETIMKEICFGKINKMNKQMSKD